MAEVAGIFIASDPQSHLRPVSEVRALVGKGLEGDRYALEIGSFSRWPGSGRAVTLIEAEVIDLRSIRPFDTETLIESVKKTNRAVAVQEQWRWFSVASEVAALIQEFAFDYLDAPVERVSGAEVPAPYSKSLEAAAFPNEQDIIDAARRALYRKG